MQSIIQADKKCYKTGSNWNLHKHHIFFGNPWRKLSEKYGLWVYLRADWHNASNYGVHFDHELDLELKHIGQRAFEKKHGSRADFRKIFGKNYLDDEEEPNADG